MTRTLIKMRDFHISYSKKYFKI